MKKLTNSEITTIAAAAIVTQLTRHSGPSARALMFRISTLTQAAAKQGPAAFGKALSRIQANTRAFFDAGRTESRVPFAAVSILAQTAAKQGPASFGFALRQIDTIARNFFDTTRA